MKLQIRSNSFFFTSYQVLNKTYNKKKKKQQQQQQQQQKIAINISHAVKSFF